MRVGVIYLLVCFGMCLNNPNIACNGDFQSYTNLIVNSAAKEAYRYFPNDACWYSKYTTNIEIKMKIGITTNCADLATIVPIALCQQPVFDVGSKYRITYQLYIDRVDTISTTISLGDRNIGSGYFDGQLFYNHTLYFYPERNSEELCFKGSWLGTYHKGPLFDNLTIVKAQYYSLNIISVQIFKYQENIVLSTTNFYEEVVVINIEQLYKITLKGVLFEYVIENNTVTGNIDIRIYPTMNFWINNIQFNSADAQDQFFYLNTSFFSENEYYQMEFYYYLRLRIEIFESNSTAILKTNITYDERAFKQIFQHYAILVYGISIGYYFAEKDSQTENTNILVNTNFSFAVKDIQFKKIANIFKVNLSASFVQDPRLYYQLNEETQRSLKTLEKVLQWVMDINSQFFSFMKTYLFSYFVLNLLGFWNLSLFYILMLIPIVPSFTQEIYYQLLHSMLNESNIFVWASKMFNTPQSFYKLSDALNIGHMAQVQKQGLKWLGYLEISTDVLQNDYFSFMLLIWAITKILIIILIKKIILQKCCKVFIITRITFSSIFFAQIVAMTPEIVMSALLCAIQPQNLYQQQFHKAFQLILLLFCILSWGLYSIQEYKRSTTKYAFQTKEISKLSKNSQTLWFIETSQNLMMFTTPFFLIVENKLTFLIINSILITLRTAIYVKNLCYLKKQELIKQGLLSIIWIAHQIIFWLFYMIHNKQNQLQNIISNYSELIITLGFLAILTVFLGGAVEIVGLLVEFVTIIAHHGKQIRQTINNQMDKKKTNNQTIGDIQGQNQGVKIERISVSMQNTNNQVNKGEIISKNQPYHNEDIFYIPVIKLSETDGLKYKKQLLNFQKQKLKNSTSKKQCHKKLRIQKMESFKKSIQPDLLIPVIKLKQRQELGLLF